MSVAFSHNGFQIRIRLEIKWIIEILFPPVDSCVQGAEKLGKICEDKHQLFTAELRQKKIKISSASEWNHAYSVLGGQGNDSGMRYVIRLSIWLNKSRIQAWSVRAGHVSVTMTTWLLVAEVWININTGVTVYLWEVLCFRHMSHPLVWKRGLGRHVLWFCVRCQRIVCFYTTQLLIGIIRHFSYLNRNLTFDETQFWV